jgi:putative membrane protein
MAPRLRGVLKLVPTDTVAARLLGAFLLVSIVPVAVAGVLVYRTGQQTLREELDARLGTVRYLRTQQIHTWLDSRRQDVLRPSLYRDFRREVAAIAATPRPAPALVESIREVLEQNRVSGGLTEMFLLSTGEGVVMVSTDPEQEGMIKADRPYYHKWTVGPVAHHLYYSMARGGAVLAFSTPVMGSDDTPVAILVGRADLRFVDELMAERAGLGTTGHTFLVNRYNYFVSASLGSGKDGYRPVFSEGIKRALAGDSGTAVYKSHDGQVVVGAYGQIPELGYAMLAEMSTEEAFAPVYRFRIAISGLLVIVCAAALLIGIRLTWDISRPITRLAEAAAAIGEGDLQYRVPIDGAPEVTSLAKAFNGMAEHLARSRSELMAHSTELAKKNTELNAFTYSVSHDLTPGGLPMKALIVAAVLCLSVAGAAAQPLTDAQIAHIVVTANQVDIDAAHLAVKNSGNADVKRFADLMVKDHTDVKNMAVALATKLKVTPADNPTSQSLKAGGDKNIANLKTLKGAAFDKAYMDNEVGYHQAVIEAMEKTLIPGASNAELKALLVKVLPAFLGHLEHAKKVQSSLK